MKFKKFENKTEYLEYLQIFIYVHLFLNKRTDFHIDDYIDFELTDKYISSFNDWIESDTPNAELIINWFTNNQKQVSIFKSEFQNKYKPKVSVWSDRKKTKYYKAKLQDSFIFENFIAELIQEKYGIDLGQYLSPEGQYELGENALGIEIKNDTLIEKYGNVYIEYQEKSRADNFEYVNSGILKNDNCMYFLIGTRYDFYIFRKARLVEILKEEFNLMEKGIPSKRTILFKQIATSKGYVYPVKIAITDTISLDEMMKEIIENKSV